MVYTICQKKKVSSKKRMIKNPKTGRWVLRSGKIGQALLKHSRSNKDCKNLCKGNSLSNKKSIVTEIPLHILQNKCGRVQSKQRGNDGNMYINVKNSRNIYQWKKA